MNHPRAFIKISEDRIDEINAFLTKPSNEMVGRLLEIVEKYRGLGQR